MQSVLIEQGHVVLVTQAVRRGVFVLDLADFQIGATPFVQKSLLILLDTHVREEHDHFEVSQFKARLPLPNPRAVSLTVGSASSAKRAVRPRLVFLRSRGA